MTTVAAGELACRDFAPSFEAPDGAVADDFNDFDAAFCDAATLPRDDIATALSGFAIGAFAVLAAAFFTVEGVEDFLCDFLDIRLPFVAFRRTMKCVLSAGWRNR